MIWQHVNECEGGEHSPPTSRLSHPLTLHGSTGIQLRLGAERAHQRGRLDQIAAHGVSDSREGR